VDELLQPGDLLEQLDRDMPDGSGTGGAVVGLAGIGLYVGDQLLEIADRQLGVDGKNQWRG
jgi:hypothetical protein